jgi:hypothetical protein
MNNVHVIFPAADIVKYSSQTVTKEGMHTSAQSGLIVSNSAGN